jgi:glucan phosphoethanolaminetransferase (alkaline phosphatase superfamily)
MSVSSSDARGPGLGPVVLLAPLIFIAHFLEEAPEFVDWFNAHVARGITPELFWTVNFTALAITLAVVAIEWLTRTAASAILVVAWFGFLFFANAFLHIAATLADGAYMAGLITAVLLYLPFYAWIIARILRTRRLSPAVTAVSAILGAIPMLMHGYLIIYRGSRLF